MSKIVEIARAEIGTKESPKNSNKTKYGKWFGLDGLAWCGMFVSWCYAMRGKPLPNIGYSKGFAGCQTAVAYFRKNKRIVSYLASHRQNSSECHPNQFYPQRI